MSKIELDDQILDHPKFVRAVKHGGSDTIFLWLGLRSYCSKLLTDGFIPDDMLDEVRGPKETKKRMAALDVLIDSKLVHRVTDGIVLHDYLDWASSREDVLRWRESAKARKAKSRNVSQRDGQRDGQRDTGVRHSDGTAESQCPPHAHASRMRVPLTSPSQTTSRSTTTETGTVAAIDSGKIPCPPTLRLTEEQRSVLETSLIPGWAIDELTNQYVAAEVADQTKTMPLSAWHKCLSRAISGNWNNQQRRPKKPQVEGEQPKTGGLPGQTWHKDGYWYYAIAKETA